MIHYDHPFVATPIRDIEHLGVGGEGGQGGAKHTKADGIHVSCRCCTKYVDASATRDTPSPRTVHDIYMLRVLFLLSIAIATLTPY